MKYIILGRTKDKDITEIETNKGIRNKERYFYIRNLAWKILIENNIVELPIDLTKIIDNNKIQLNAYNEIDNPNLKEITKDCLGLTIKDHKTNKVYILYDNNLSEEVTRFTIAHEIGHYYLNHLQESPQKETEANMLAARILMPIIVLHELNITSAEQIKNLCKVSYTASEYRYKRFLDVKERNKFYVSKLEQKVAGQFKNFVKQKKEEK